MVTSLGIFARAELVIRLNASIRLGRRVFLRSNSGGVSRRNGKSNSAPIVIKSVEHVEHKLIILF